MDGKRRFSKTDDKTKPYLFKGVTRDFRDYGERGKLLMWEEERGDGD